MIHKLVHIKGLGKFSNYHSGSGVWNGIFAKVTSVYAENGSGKTTFTQIFKSLKDDNEQLLLKRRSFGSENPISIQFTDSKNQ